MAAKEDDDAVVCAGFREMSLECVYDTLEGCLIACYGYNVSVGPAVKFS